MGKTRRNFGDTLYNIFVYFCLIVAALMIGLYQADFDISPRTLEDRASKIIGRTVSMGDDVELSFFPSIGFKVSTLRIDNAPGMSDPFFLEVSNATIRVKIIPLLTGNVEISQFVLDRPVLHFERNSKGDINWDLTSKNEDDQPATQANTNNNGTPARLVRDLNLGIVKVTKGLITYRDKRSDIDIVAEDVTVDLKLSSLKKPATIKGAFTYLGKPVTIDAGLSNINALRNQGSSEGFINTSFIGSTIDSKFVMKHDDAISYNGSLSADIESVRDVLSWLERPVDVKYGFEALEVSGDMSGSTSFISFDNASIRFDAIKGKGKFKADWGRSRPLISGDLSLDTLDVKPYSPAQTITDGEGFPPWSRTPIDLNPLKIVDMEFSVQTKKLLARNLDIDDTKLLVDLKRGLLKATLNAITLYDGTGTGTLTINTRNRTPSFAAKFSLLNMDTKRFLKDATGSERLEGNGDLSFDITARGNNQYAMVSSLNGNGKYTVRDGSIIGFNFLKFAYRIGIFVRGQSQGTSQDDAERTAFTALESNFTIRNGLIRTDDVALLSPLLRITGEGSVNLPPQTLNLRFKPRLVASLTGQGGDRNRQGIGIPLKVTGTFNDPEYGLDVGRETRDRVEDEVRKRVPIPDLPEGVPDPEDILGGILKRP